MENSKMDKLYEVDVVKNTKWFISLEMITMNLLVSIKM
jgi:hypothetical protein